jgi:hypothetical protein
MPYESLTLQNQLGETIAIVESFDGRLHIAYAQTNNIQLALRDTLSNGFFAPRNVEGSFFTLKAKPTDADFLKKLGRLLQISYDCLPLYELSESLQAKGDFSWRDFQLSANAFYPVSGPDIWTELSEETREEGWSVVCSSDITRLAEGEDYSPGQPLQYCGVSSAPV